jgi:hypothetical protein
MHVQMQMQRRPETQGQMQKRRREAKSITRIGRITPSTSRSRSLPPSASTPTRGGRRRRKRCRPSRHQRRLPRRRHRARDSTRSHARRPFPRAHTLWTTRQRTRTATRATATATATATAMVSRPPVTHSLQMTLMKRPATRPPQPSTGNGRNERKRRSSPRSCLARAGAATRAARGTTTMPWTLPTWLQVARFVPGVSASTAGIVRPLSAIMAATGTRTEKCWTWPRRAPKPT